MQIKKNSVHKQNIIIEISSVEKMNLDVSNSLKDSIINIGDFLLKT